MTDDDGRPPVPVVGIGYSAGGLEALTAMLDAIDPPTGLAWVVMQHAGETEPSQLAAVLRQQTTLPVDVASDRMALQADRIYVAPSGQVMRYEDGIMRLATRDVHRPHHEIDTMLMSLADGLGRRCIGVVLSGTLRDGVAGLRAVKAAGGFTLTQTLDSARFADLPAAVVEAHAADLVLPPRELGIEVQRLGKAILEGPAAADAPDEALQVILQELLLHTGVDFQHYKRSTLMRRIARRIAATQCKDMRAYAKRLPHDADEVADLFGDLLINVTGFFRDQSFFDALRRNVVDAMLEGHSGSRPLRVWVPGCATGEETYSIAIVFLEAMDAANVRVPLQIFGTDLSETAIRHARAGIYTEASLEPVSAERRSRFFEAYEDGHRISKRVRDACIFAVHDLTRDPPFSNIDLLSCRNVLIYMDRELQKQVFRVFHYALRENGMLALGPSEALTEAQELFEPIGDSRIYRRRPGPPHVARAPHGATPHDSASATTVHLTRMAQDLMTQRYGLSALALTHDLHLAWAQGSMRIFLRDGESKRDMSGEDLKQPIREALAEVAQAGHSTRCRLADGSVVQVLPVGDPGDANGGFLVVCEAAGRQRAPAKQHPLRRIVRRLGGPRRPSAKEELAALRAYMQHVIEDYEATTEELRSANEEALSSNEELQSTNEELQSAHAELATLNEEMRERVNEISAARDEFGHMFHSLELPVVAVGTDLRIRRFTPQAGEAMNIIDSDVGRPVTDIHTGLDRAMLKQQANEVVQTLQVRRSTVNTDDGEEHTLVVSPLRGGDGQVTGTLLILLPRPGDAVDAAATDR